MGSLNRSWTLVKESFTVLKKDKELLFFPILSGVFTILLFISFIIPIFFTGSFPFNSYLGLFVFYLLSYFIVIFFNAGLIICANIRLSGGDPTVKDGLVGAVKHVGNIFIWAIIAATVGLLLRALSEKAENNLLAQLVISFLGMAWSLLTFFVVPIMVLEKVSPFRAIKESTLLFKKVWGETVVGNFSINGVFLLAYILLIALGIGSFFLFGSASLPFIGLLILLGLGLAILAGTLNGIFVTALYRYASNGELSDSFSSEHIKSAFVRK